MLWEGLATLDITAEIILVCLRDTRSGSCLLNPTGRVFTAESIAPIPSEDEATEKEQGFYLKAKARIWP